MPALAGKSGWVTLEPEWFEDTNLCASHQRVWVRLDGNDDFEYAFTVGELLYENSEPPEGGLHE